jgi:hypothetical protein
MEGKPAVRARHDSVDRSVGVLPDQHWQDVHSNSDNSRFDSGRSDCGRIFLPSSDPGNRKTNVSAKVADF